MHLVQCCTILRIPFTYSLMELSPSWEAATVQVLKNFQAFYGTQRYITVFTRALYWSLSWARSIQSVPSHPAPLRSIFQVRDFLWSYATSLFFMVRSCVPHPQPPKLEHHPLSAVRDSFNIFVATLHIWRPSPPSVTWGRALPWWQETHVTWSLRIPAIRRNKHIFCAVRLLRSLVYITDTHFILSWISSDSYVPAYAHLSTIYTRYNQWRPNTRKSNNIHSLSFEYPHSIIQFPLPHTVTAILNRRLSVNLTRFQFLLPQNVPTPFCFEAHQWGRQVKVVVVLLLPKTK
jgi:hypothetical protein